MPTPTVDIDNLVVQCLPGAQRQTKWVLFTRALNSQVKRLNLLFQYFMNGSVDTGYWSNAVTYSLGERVRSLTGVYESLVNGNLANPVTDATKWLKVLGNFIGANERARYNGGYLTLTWALNRYFNTTFRQPPYPAPYDFGLGGGTFSDIYITDDPIIIGPFVAGLDSATSSKVGVSTTTAYVPIAPIYTTSTSYGFIVHIPVGVWTALGTTGAIRNSIVNNFVSKYAAAGTHWRIVTY